jgi:monoamine oxidase
LAALRETPDGRYRLSLEKGVSSTEVVADFVVLALPFAVLRTLDCSGAGFDGLKQKAIHNLGRGRSAKLQLQFTKRLWNEHGPWGCSTGTTFTSCGYQNTWEPTRSQRGDGGILNNFTGGTHVEQLTTKKVFLQMPSSTLHEDAKSFLQAANSVFPGLPRLWNSKATISIPHLWPLFNCSYSYWRVGQYQSIAGSARRMFSSRASILQSSSRAIWKEPRKRASGLRRKSWSNWGVRHRWGAQEDDYRVIPAPQRKCTA